MGLWEKLFGWMKPSQQPPAGSGAAGRQAQPQSQDRPYAAPGLPRPGQPAPPRLPPQRPVAQKLNLDPGQFTPLPEKDVKQQAKTLTWNWASVNFDRQDQIPPASDPRAALIDRALVAQGLLTPEQLVEIHEVGATMAELRPELKNLHVIAQNAVAADAAERAARRAQKKAEAEQRRREHAEAVAKRRATDIIFLGRGVSGGLADRRANIERLQTQGRSSRRRPTWRRRSGWKSRGCGGWPFTAKRAQ